ncbi:MAG: CHASE2 domain-containing protein [Candidatus Ozemobacteraceae bacterium]
MSETPSPIPESIPTDGASSRKAPRWHTFFGGVSAMWYIYTKIPGCSAFFRGARSLSDRAAFFLPLRMRFFLGLLFGIFLAALCLFPQSTAWIDRFIIGEELWFLSFFRAPSPSLVIVTIDETSLQRMHQTWPLPRSLHARVLERIASDSPRTIVCDILYQHAESSSQGEGDRDLASTIRRLGNVGLVSLLEPSGTERGLGIRSFPSLKEIRRAAAFEGFVWAFFDADAKSRSFVAAEGRTDAISMAVMVAKRVNPDARFPAYDENRLSRSYIAFSRRGGGIPSVSAADVLEGKIPSGMFRNRIVIFGVSASNQRDFHYTPVGEIPGALHLAWSIDTFLSNRVVAPGSHWGWALFMSIAGGFGGLLFFLKEGFFKLRGGFPGLSVSLVGVLVFGIFTHVQPPPGIFVVSWLGTTLFLWGLTTCFDIMETQRFRREADVVGELQKQFFPEGVWKSDLGYECFGTCHPCDKAGGDYFDYHEYPDRSLFFMIGDVSGHGFAAGLVTAMAKAVMTRFRQGHTKDLEEMCDGLNAVLLTSLQKAKMMTGILGHLYPEEGRITLRFAGHLPAYQVKPSGEVLEVGTPGYPFGAMRKKAPLRTCTREVQLDKGDMLVFYTDGIVEALDWDDNQFSFEHLKEFLKPACSFETIQSLIDATIEETRKHTKGRPFLDDVTMLVIRRLEDRA